VRFHLTKTLALYVLVTVGVVVSPAVGPSPLAVQAATFIAGSSSYQAVPPSRLADTRAEEGAFGFTRISANVVRVQVASRGGVPANASAAVLNVTGVNTPGPGFITVYPAGTTLPTASNVNLDRRGQVMANMVTVKLGVDGSVDIFSNVPLDVAVDVSGAYVPVSGPVASGRLVTRSDGAFRVLDTRDRGVAVPRQGVETVNVSSAGVPADAVAVVVNLTATEGGIGFWTAYPENQPKPNASNLNIDLARQTRAGQAIILLSGGSRAFNVFTLGGGHLIVDVTGWFTGATAGASTDGLFIPANPVRLLDTRNVYPLAPWGGSTVEFAVGGPLNQVSAVAANVTGTDSMLAGFITAFPSGVPKPLASNLNFDTYGQTVANHSIVRVSGRGASVFTSNGVHMIADLAGWYLGTPSTATLGPPNNPSFGPTKANQVIAAAIGAVGVGTGDNLDAVANLGIAATWNGAALLGVPGNTVLFGHRTIHGAPFRNLDSVPVGGAISMIGDDGHSYNYVVVGSDVTQPDFDPINAIGLASGPSTVQLVACTPLGSIRFRIVVTARLISVT
jgi:Sortase domain